MLERSRAGAAPAPTADPEYTVQKGDNLSKIVREHLSARGHTPSSAQVYRSVREIARHNGISDPNVIYPGQRLDLSPLTPTAPVTAPESVPAPAGGQPTLRSTAALAQSAKASQTPAEPTMEMLGGGFTVAGLRLARGRSDSPSTVSARRLREALEAQGGPTALQARATGSLVEPVERDSTGLAEMVRRILERKEMPSETPATANPASPWRTTLRGPARLSSEFGIRKDPFTGRPAFHDGIDLAAKRGTPIHAFRAGVVTYSGWKAGYGRVVIVRHDDGLESVYGHNAENFVEKGMRVTPETPLARVGSTGRSTGPHLHFEVRRDGQPVNPVPYLTASLEAG